MQFQRTLSFNSRGSRVASFRHMNHQRNLSGNLSINSSPSDSFRAPQWMNSPIQANHDRDLVHNSSDSEGKRKGNYYVTDSSTVSTCADPFWSPYLLDSCSKEGCPSACPADSNMLESVPPSLNALDCPPAWSKIQPSSSRRHSIHSRSFFSRHSHHSSSHQLSRQISDSRIHALNALNSSPLHVFDGRHSFKLSGSSGDSTVGSHGGTSDWWSMQTFSDLVASSRRERLRWIDATSPSDFGWVPCRESMDGVSLAAERIRANNLQVAPMSPHVDVQTCGICLKLLSQRSFKSENVMAGNDLSVVAVLVCGHAYHAECLEQKTSEESRHDPLCPICVASEEMPSKQLTSPVEQVVQFNRGALRAYRSQSQSSTRNKMSRIGVANDDIGGPEFSSGGTTLSSKNQLSSGAIEKSSINKPLFRRHFSFRGKSFREHALDDSACKSMTTRDSGESSTRNDFSLSHSKKGRSSSFRYFKKWA